MLRPDSAGAPRDDAPTPRRVLHRLGVARSARHDVSGRLVVTSDHRLAWLYGPAATAEADGLSVLMVVSSDSGHFIPQDASPKVIELVVDFVRAAEPRHPVDV